MAYRECQVPLIAKELREAYSSPMKDLFAERFRGMRQQAGLTLDDIAEVCLNRSGEAPSRAAIAQWEKADGTRPSFDNLVAAAKRMRVSIDYLTGLTDNPAMTTAFYASEKLAEYRTLSAEAYALARQWDRLPPAAQRAIRELLDTMKTMTEKRGQ